jgi:RimJ/RimL family protein N-acetyltransferase
MEKEGAEYEQKVLQEIHAFKHSHYGTVKISKTFQGTPYNLFLLTSGCDKNSEIVTLLARWREKHGVWFPAIFPVSIDGTAIWLKKKVIETPDRLLFMIQVNQRYIGHVGLFRFRFGDKACEIDNIVRGEDSCPGIMGEAIGQMMEWGRVHLGLRRYELQTFSDNQKSIKLYHRLGFFEVRKVPMQCVRKEDRTEWVEVPGTDLPKVERYNVYMELLKKGSG